MSRTSRKLDHIKHALELGQSGQHGFEDVHFVANSLPESNLDEIELRTQVGGLSLSSPLLINAMTGGGSEETYRINQQLAIIAKEKGLAMAVGSQMAALRDESQEYTYTVVRKENPNGLIFANIGAEASIVEAVRAVEMLEADALQVHMNVIQELVMPEGDRKFKGWLRKIEKIVEGVACPVIVKEVGFGLGYETVRKLHSIGVKVVDVGGFGGTNFAAIENKRRVLPYTFFNQWGIKTVPSIIEALHVHSDLEVIASGGVSTAEEMMKSLLLGTKAVGLAGLFLRLIKEHSLAEIFEIVDMYHEQLRVMMCALGISKLEESAQVPLVICGESAHWLGLRGINVSQYAQRGR